VGPSLLQGVWFPSYLPLDGTGSYPDFLGRNRQPTVPRVHDPDKGTNLCIVYNYHDSCAYSYKWFGILSRLDGLLWNGLGWFLV
jgi:hypothetical protein